MKTLIVALSMSVCVSGILHAGCEPPNEWPRVEKHYGGVASCPNYELIGSSVDFWTLHYEEEDNKGKQYFAVAYNHWDGAEVWRCRNMKDLVDWTVTGHSNWQRMSRGGHIRVDYTPPSWTLDLTAKVDMSRYIPDVYKPYPQKSFGKYGLRRRIYSAPAAIAYLGIKFLQGFIWLLEWISDPLLEGLRLTVDVIEYSFFGAWEPGVWEH